VKERQPRTAPHRLLIVGAVAHYKRIEVAVRALARLQRNGGDYELVLAGEEWPGHGDVIDQAARVAGVGRNLRRLGGVSAERLPELFAGAHATLSLSSCESFGIPVVEAMRAGLPAVVADEPWSEELVGAAAVRVDGSSPASVAAGIRALESEDEWQRRAEAGRRVAARYTWAATAAGIVAVARGLTAHADPAGPA
jgi:glycosyltransferase involved in cell wall biosynthesis